MSQNMKQFAFNVKKIFDLYLQTNLINKQEDIRFQKKLCIFQ